MDSFGLYLAIFAVVIIGGAIQMATVTRPGKQLHAKFVGMGTLAGRTKDEIIAEVGPPTSVSGLPDGKTLLQWQATGCHMALRFAGDICEGITHEHVQQG